MKKGLFLVLILLFGVTSVAMAAPPPTTTITPVVNVSQQGSMLVFTKIDVSNFCSSGAPEAIPCTTAGSPCGATCIATLYPADDTTPCSAPGAYCVTSFGNAGVCSPNPGTCEAARDTIVSITNSGPAPVNVHCYWINGKDQQPHDFTLELTAHHPVVFDARYGVGEFPFLLGYPVFTSPFNINGDGNVGELKCFAVDTATGTKQIKWNYLTGTAKTIDYLAAPPTAYEYNAWSFAGIPKTNTLVCAGSPTVSCPYLGGTCADGSLCIDAGNGASIGTPGTILMDGTQYSACPAYWQSNFFASGAGQFISPVWIPDSDLTLVPCKEDVRQNHAFTYTKAVFTVWDELETPHSGSYQCMECFYEDFLTKVGFDAPNTTNPGNFFTLANLGTIVGYFRVQGVADQSKCATIPGITMVNSPLLGLLVEEVEILGDISKTATTGFTFGTDPSGSLIWH
jgi:hypothetical protein